MNEKKPKCHGCNKRGEENTYYWHQGAWWHLSCLIAIGNYIQQIKHERS